MNCVVEVENFGRGSVMMWGAISYTEKLNWCTSTATLMPLNTELRYTVLWNSPPFLLKSLL
jgi:hypothetical protein